MTIEYITGNMIGSPDKLYLHGCNAQGRMGSGVAVAIRNAYPEAYAAYRRDHHLGGLTMGTVVYAEITENETELYIANGITQDRYGYDNGVYIDYKAINSVMVSVNTFAREHDIIAVAMPLIGAGLGGGSWKMISNIIETQLVDTQPNVYLLDGVVPNS